MKYLWPSLLAVLLLITGCKNPGKEKDSSNIISENKLDKYAVLLNDTIIYHPNFSSKYVDDRNVEIWLPPGYTTNPSEAYKVIYMHDGQNIFDQSTAYGNVEWGIDETMDSLVQNKLVPPAIVIGIWNNGRKRFPEYMPQVPEEHINNPQAQALLKENFGVTELLSNNYLKFIVEELKPFVDSTYNTSLKREDTSIMGSSMGGLISLYALTSYPETFGAAACVSTHWPVPLIGEVFINQLTTTLPMAGDHKIYFDYGTRGLDEDYEPYQLRVDEIMRSKGYQPQQDWISMKIDGAGHNESSWKKRAHIPLKFLLKK
ncbi:esterase [Antarcticibacterium flavum]|uniref:Esterase n=1 Tax=Antarcticibacterium flavum TaxID=2058175 RepID=A0A5B7X1Q5_9FLAO|nr:MULTISPECIES: alpha/beta hydrolase-fold protein [Antarcticibacterium]MCM4158698.1 esterase [Antarcticibacterium sp. W02-3]QCY68551.1 esterase [Antarcticibacterium flavum]